MAQKNWDLLSQQEQTFYLDMMASGVDPQAYGISIPKNVSSDYMNGITRLNQNGSTAGTPGLASTGVPNGQFSPATAPQQQTQQMGPQISNTQRASLQHDNSLATMGQEGNPFNRTNGVYSPDMQSPSLAGSNSDYLTQNPVVGSVANDGPMVNDYNLTRGASDVGMQNMGSYQPEVMANPVDNTFTANGMGPYTTGMPDASAGYAPSMATTTNVVGTDGGLTQMPGVEGGQFSMPGDTTSTTDWGMKGVGGTLLGAGQLGLGVASYFDTKKQNAKSRELMDQQIASNEYSLAATKKFRGDVSNAFA